jgi:hypothetical protein
MNLHLTPAQIDEIIDGAEHVDMPAEQLVAAAAEIRATLLAASDDAIVLAAWPSVDDDAPTRTVDPLRRARVVRSALVAAALAFALMLSAAVSGALPDPIQSRVAQVAELFGVDLPAAASQPTAGETPNATREDTRASKTSAGGTNKSGGSATDTDVSRSTAVSTAAPATTPGTDVTTTIKPDAPEHPATPTGPPEDPGVNANRPAENPGQGVGPPEDPGRGVGSPDNPGQGVGPPDSPGQGNGNGPPENPGQGNGNGG